MAQVDSTVSTLEGPWIICLPKAFRNASQRSNVQVQERQA